MTSMPDTLNCPARLRKRALPVLLAGLVVLVILFALVRIAGRASSYRASVAGEILRNATRVELLPREDLFTSLTCDEPVSFSSDQLDSMGFPASATITDANTIGQFAQLMDDTGFQWTFSRYPRTIFSMCVTAYRGDETLGSFEINGNALYVPGFGSFRTRRSTKDLQRELRRILPYGQRMENVIRRSGDLRFMALTLQVDVLSQGHAFSSVKDRWCDAILEFASTHVEETAASLREQPYAYGFKVDAEAMIQSAREDVAAIERVLAPDANGIRRRPFALNSQYGENPEDDTILLFETEPGWNKVGGPELLSSGFTDPNGCFVYLDGDGVTLITNEQVERIKAAAEKAIQQNAPLEFRLSTLLEAIGISQKTPQAD